MLLIVTAQGLMALALAMQTLHSMCLSLPVIPVTKAHWPMPPTVLLSQVLTGIYAGVRKYTCNACTGKHCYICCAHSED